ncbi:MAG: dTDP-glucose 4,6-dehydratase [Candidatus Marinimicrobia bacterium]|nr:dTDP-glucose 4,6-dehydratase [Candidatus Neomarinimicrobiota bacterium]
MKILILGSGSFAGQALFSDLKKNGFNVVGINRSPVKSKEYWPWIKKFNDGFNWLSFNIKKEPEKFKSLLKSINPTHIIDFMGQGMVAQSWEDPKLWYSTNLAEKSFILESIRDLSELKKYVRASTPEVYGSNNSFINEDSHFKPSTPYAISHAAIDFHLRCMGDKYNFPYSIGRFSNFYGEGQQLYRVIPRAILSCLTGKKFILEGNGMSRRSFIYSSDIAESIKLLLFKAQNKSEFNFSGDEEITIKDLIKLICEITNNSYEKIVEIGPDRPSKDMIYRLDCRKAKQTFNWSPNVNLKTGLQKTIQWIEQNIHFFSNENWNYIHKD